MMKLILSTSNIIGAGSAIRRPTSAKSNAELVSSLRSNFEAHASLPNGHPNGTATVESEAGQPPIRPNYRSWTRYDEASSTLEVPSLDFADSSLEEEREQYDITIKLFYLPGAPAADREAQTREALSFVLQELHMSSVDLLIVSFPGIYFDEEEDCPNKISTRGPVESEPEPLESQIHTWHVLEALQREGLVKKLGVAEFGHDRLHGFLSHTNTKPNVNQINLRDCCSVPKDLMALAKSNAVELLVHNDCSNILPRGTVRELLGPGPGGAKVLAIAPNLGDKRKSLHEEQRNMMASEGIRGEVQPLWVIKYTAVVKNRGVVENKGYFAGAEVKG